MSGPIPYSIDRKSPVGYLIAGLLGAIARAASMIGLARLIPNMRVNCMKKTQEEGIEPPECCKGLEARKTSVKKRKK